MQQPRCDIGRLVETGLAHRIGQAGVGVATDEGIGRDLGQLLDVGAHQRSAQRAVEADGQRLRMPDAVPERGHGLAAQDATRCIGHGAADDQRQPLAAVVEILVDCEQRGLGVERVEDGLDQDHVGTAFDQRFGLLVVGRAQRFEVDIACAGVVHIGADAGRLGRRAECAHHEARLFGRAELVAGGAGQLGGFEVHLARQVRHLVVLLRDRGGAEGIGFDQIRARGQVAFVDVLNDIGPSQREQLIVAFDVPLEVLEALAAVLRFVELEALDHRAHRTIEDGDALGKDARQCLAAGVDERLHAANCRNRDSNA